MKQPLSFSEERLQAALEQVLDSGAWGTIGPRSKSAAKKLCELTGCEAGLLLSSPAGAAETVLRALELSAGDEVLLPACCSPFLKEAVEAVGANCVFCEVSDGLLIRPDRIEGRIAPATAAIIVEDLCGYPADSDTLRAIADKRELPLILCCATPYLTALHGKPTAHYADFTIVPLPVQNAAAILCPQAFLPKLYGAHHCGNPYGTQGGLNTGICLGGDMRIDDWRAAALEVVFDSAHDRAILLNTVKIRLWEALCQKGLLPVDPVFDGDISGTHLLFYQVPGAPQSAPPDYRAYTEDAQAKAEKILVYPVD